MPDEVEDSSKLKFVEKTLLQHKVKLYIEREVKMKSNITKIEKEILQRYLSSARLKTISSCSD